MGVASHLRIRLDDYDRRIRTFIPDYDALVDAAASAIGPRTRRIVDLGVGTGALAARCLLQAPDARVVGIDTDPAIAALAARRLGPRAKFLIGDFARIAIPRADAFVASLALHHVATRAAKRRLFRRLHDALATNGVLVSADCHPATARRLAAAEHAAWRAHLRRTYSPARTRALFDAWADEDVYVPLEIELRLMRDAGFITDIVWRCGIFAVIVASRARTRD